MIRPRITLLILAAIALMGSQPLPRLEAQELPRSSFASLRYAPAEAGAAPRTIAAELRDSIAVPRTYWLEGALIVGIPLALLGAAFAGGACSDSDSGAADAPCWDNVLLGAVVGLGTGASLGGLIGGQFKKKSRKESVKSAR